MKNLFTDKKLFLYRSIGVSLIFIFLVCDFILVLNTTKIKHALSSHGEKLSYYYAFFTTQSNYLVFVYFVIYLFQIKFKNSKPDFIIRLMITVYITMTMIIFWLGLFTQDNLAKNASIYEWISTIILHTVIPIIMIISFIMTAGDNFYNFDNHHKNNYWLICLYPFVYLICVLIRGYIRHLDNKSEYTLFPYFFLNFYNTNGLPMLAAGSVLVFTLCTVFQYFYIWINNLYYFKKQIKQNNINQIDKIKIISNIKKYKKIDKKGQIALIMSIIISIINIIFSFLYYFLRDIWSKIFDFPYKLNIIFAFTIIINIFSIIVIIFSILGLLNFYWARILVGFLSIALICFNWIWVIGPIFDISIAFLCLNNAKYSQKDFKLFLLNQKNKNL